MRQRQKFNFHKNGTLVVVGFIVFAFSAQAQTMQFNAGDSESESMSMPFSPDEEGGAVGGEETSGNTSSGDVLPSSGSSSDLGLLPGSLNTSGGSLGTSGGSLVVSSPTLDCSDTTSRTLHQKLLLVEQRQREYDAAKAAYLASLTPSAQAANIVTADVREFSCDQTVKRSPANLVLGKLDEIEKLPVSSVGPKVIELPRCSSGAVGLTATGSQLTYACKPAAGQLVGGASSTATIPSSGAIVVAKGVDVVASGSNITKSLSIVAEGNIDIEGQMTVSPASISSSSSSANSVSCSAIHSETCAKVISEGMSQAPSASLTLAASQTIRLKPASNSISISNLGVLTTSSEIQDLVGEGEVSFNPSNSGSESSGSSNVATLGAAALPVTSVIQANLVAGQSITFDPALSSSAGGNVVLAGSVWGDIQTAVVSQTANGSCAVSGVNPVLVPVTTVKSVCNQGDKNCPAGLGIETGGWTWVRLNSTEGTNGNGGPAVLASSGGGANTSSSNGGQPNRQAPPTTTAH